ncbi:hypothetical protein EMCRGX_G022378 [Ephydatia muelleri]
MQFFEQSSHSFVEQSDLTDSFGKAGVNREDLTKQLEQLVQDGHLGRRAAFGTTLYWLKTPSGCASSSSTSSSLLQTPPSCPAKRTQCAEGTPLGKRQRVDLTARSPMVADSRKSLQAELQDKRDKLRKLKLVQLYNSKNNLQKLEELICKWRTVSQEAAECLLQKTSIDPRPSLGQLLQFLQVDFNLIHYSPADESFY